MAAEAIFNHCDDTRDVVLAAAASCGEVYQLQNGRAAVCVPAGGGSANDKVAFREEGRFWVTKTSGITLLPGGRVYWDHSANSATYLKVNDRDFFLGTVVLDAASSDTKVLVDLNVLPWQTIDLARDAFLSVPTGTQAVGAFGYPKVLGGSHQIELTATSEAQCIDLLSVDRVAVGAKPILEAIFTVPTNGSGAAVDFNIGLADGTHTTDADSIANSVFVHIDGASTNLNVESDDGTTEVAATDTTLDLTEGSAVANRVEVWIDARDTAAVKVYINGVRVLDGTTGSEKTLVLTAATGPLGLLAHLEKTSGTTTGKYCIHALRLRTMQQAV